MSEDEKSASYVLEMATREAEALGLVRGTESLREWMGGYVPTLKNRAEKAEARVAVLEKLVDSHAETATMALNEAERGEDEIQNLRARVAELEMALAWFADEGHYEGTYRHGAGFVDAVGLTQARAALLGMSPDDADAVGQAWRKRIADSVSDTKGPGDEPR